MRKNETAQRVIYRRADFYVFDLIGLHHGHAASAKAARKYFLTINTCQNTATASHRRTAAIPAGSTAR